MCEAKKESRAVELAPHCSSLPLAVGWCCARASQTTVAQVEGALLRAWSKRFLPLYEPRGLEERLGVRKLSQRGEKCLGQGRPLRGSQWRDLKCASATISWGGLGMKVSGQEYRYASDHAGPEGTDCHSFGELCGKGSLSPWILPGKAFVVAYDKVWKITHRTWPGASHLSLASTLNARSTSLWESKTSPDGIRCPPEGQKHLQLRNSVLGPMTEGRKDGYINTIRVLIGRKGEGMGNE